jgi:hypothetical protein
MCEGRKRSGISVTDEIANGEMRTPVRTGYDTNFTNWHESEQGRERDFSTTDGHG